MNRDQTNFHGTVFIGQDCKKTGVENHDLFINTARLAGGYGYGYF